MLLQNFPALKLAMRVIVFEVDKVLNATLQVNAHGLHPLDKVILIAVNSPNSN